MDKSTTGLSVIHREYIETGGVTTADDEISPEEMRRFESAISVRVPDKYLDEVTRRSLSQQTEMYRPESIAARTESNATLFNRMASLPVVTE